MKYGKQYICKRMRLYSFLIEKGFEVAETMPDIKNPKFTVWLFDNSPELEAALEEYFTTVALSR